MSTPTSEAPTEAFPPAKHTARPFIPRMIRALAVPIILVWIGVIAVLNEYGYRPLKKELEAIEK